MEVRLSVPHDVCSTSRTPSSSSSSSRLFLFFFFFLLSRCIIWPSNKHFSPSASTLWELLCQPALDSGTLHFLFSSLSISVFLCLCFALSLFLEIYKHILYITLLCILWILCWTWKSQPCMCFFFSVCEITGWTILIFYLIFTAKALLHTSHFFGPNFRIFLVLRESCINWHVLNFLLIVPYWYCHGCLFFFGIKQLPFLIIRRNWAFYWHTIVMQFLLGPHCRINGNQKAMSSENLCFS